MRYRINLTSFFGTSGKSIFWKTQNFGRLGFVEVGALSVGRIIQVHPYDTPFRRGEEKSVFNFGGSAVVVFGEPGVWRPADDILSNTKKGIETRVLLGDTIAMRTAPRQKRYAALPEKSALDRELMLGSTSR